MKTNYKSDVSYYLKQEEIKERKLNSELKKLDTNLRKIKKYVNSNKDLDVDKLVKVIIFRQLVTKDNLTTKQLFDSTKELVEDILADM